MSCLDNGTSIDKPSSKSIVCHITILVAGVGYYTLAAPSGIVINNVNVTCQAYAANASAMCALYGLKTWFPNQGVIVNNYASLWKSLTLIEPSNQYFTNTPNIPQWMGQGIASSAMNSANYVQGDLVVGWFQSGEAQSVGGCFSGPQHVVNMQALMANLTSQSTSRDVLWFYGLFDGQYWTQQRAALKAYVQ